LTRIYEIDLDQLQKEIERLEARLKRLESRDERTRQVLNPNGFEQRLDSIGLAQRRMIEIRELRRKTDH